MEQINSENYSKFFDFKTKSKSNLHSISDYIGWHGLVIIKLEMKKNETFTNEYIKSNYLDIYNKEKILIVVKGKITFNLFNKKFDLKDYDALNFFSDEKKYEIVCEENALVYIIGAKELKPNESSPIYFNFKKDILAKNLWGGQIISRPYEGRDLTVVLFALKAGFKFEDKGHANEQITWLIDGTMNFYTNGAKKMCTLYSVEIPYFCGSHQHIKPSEIGDDRRSDGIRLSLRDFKVCPCGIIFVASRYMHTSTKRIFAM